jgi:phosphate transport system permease protein
MANRSEALTTPGVITDKSEDKVDLRKRQRWGENIIQTLLFISAAISILTTIGIIYVLGKESIKFFASQMWEETNKPIVYSIDAGEKTIRVGDTGGDIEDGAIIRINQEVMLIKSINGNVLLVERGYDGTEAVAHEAGSNIFQGVRVSLIEFFTNTKWIPQIGEFGILPLINATLTVAMIAMVVALPIGLCIAIYLSEYASQRARSILKPILEVLAGIPTVVYGYFALTLMTPLLQSIFGEDVVQIYNTASAGIVIGILVVPYVASMSEDALHAVPDGLRQAAYGLGATKLETATKVVVPAAISGITAAFIVAISRAIGETMIVALAAGAGPNFTFNPFESAETMTGHIVRISGGDISYDSIDYNSIFAIGLVLFFITLILNFISQQVVRRYREVYE